LQACESGIPNPFEVTSPTEARKPIDSLPPREIGVLINNRVIFGQKATPEKLRLELSGVPLDKALKCFGAISLLACNFDGGNFFDFQKGVVNELGVGLPYAEKIIEQLKPPNVFVSVEQAAVLQKLAMLYCAPEGAPMPADFGNRMLRAMLLYNSLRGLEDVDLGDREKAFLTVELRNTFLAREAVHVLIDLYGGFFEWAKSERGRTSRHAMPVNEDFEQFFGLTYFEYAAAAFSFYAYYLSIRDVKAFGNRSPFLRVDGFLKTISSPEAIRRWLWLTAMSVADARAEFGRKHKAFYSGLSLHCFRARPLVFVEAGVAYPPHLPFLENRLGSGLYFLLLDAYNWSDGNSRRSALFTNYFADYFEQRCVQAMRDAHPTPLGVFGEKKYKVGKNEISSTDLVIVEGDSAVFIDISTTRLNLGSTLIGLDDASIERDVKKVVENAKQMTGRIAAFKTGQLVYESDGVRIDPTEIKKIYPVALTVAPVPRMFAFNKRIFEGIAAEGYLQGCEQFEVLSAEDFDLLLRLVRAGCLASGVLARKLGRETEWIRMSSFKNYLAIHDEELRQRANSKPWPGLGENWFKGLMDTVRLWGIPVE
jgi:hypothetical protein